MVQNIAEATAIAPWLPATFVEGRHVHPFGFDSLSHESKHRPDLAIGLDLDSCDLGTALTFPYSDKLQELYLEVVKPVLAG